jgi:hypothetical protein
MIYGEQGIQLTDRERASRRDCGIGEGKRRSSRNALQKLDDSESSSTADHVFCDVTRRTA